MCARALLYQATCSHSSIENADHTYSHVFVFSVLTNMNDMSMFVNHDISIVSVFDL